MALSSDDILSRAAEPRHEEVVAQVERVLASPIFQNSKSTKRLLLFLSEWAQSHPSQPVKEIELAVSVYDRSPATFDSQLDSRVRVHVGRLRSKLLEYYSQFGINDEVVLEIPKGAYTLVSHYRSGTRVAVDSQPTQLADRSLEVEEPQLPVRFLLPSWALPLSIGCLLGAALTFLIIHSRQPTVPPYVEQFWSKFAGRGQQNMIAFSNPRLSGTLSSQGLRYFREGVDSSIPGAENLTYAGAGDVRGVHTLTKLFDLLHQDLRLESGARLSWDEAKESNLIFIGRPEQNPALRELPRLREFYFKYNVGIVNAHPRPGERPVYQLSPRPYSYDHAIIAFIPGIQLSHHTLVLAGNCTYGSQAATEFLSRNASLQLLFDKLGIRPGEDIPYFEALLEVRISNEIPVRTRIIAVRPYQSKNLPTWEPPADDER